MCVCVALPLTEPEPEPDNLIFSSFGRVWTRTEPSLDLLDTQNPARVEPPLVLSCREPSVHLVTQRHTDHDIDDWILFRLQSRAFLWISHVQRTREYARVKRERISSTRPHPHHVPLARYRVTLDWYKLGSTILAPLKNPCQRYVRS